MYFPLFMGLPHMTVITTPAPQPTHTEFGCLVVVLYGTWDVSVGMSPHGRKRRGLREQRCISTAPRAQATHVRLAGLLVETWIEPPVFPSYCARPPSHLAHRFVCTMLQCFTQIHPRDCAHSVIIKK